MSALTNPVYLLLTDKTNRAYFDDYIYIKKLYKKGQNTQIDIYFYFCNAVGIDSLYQA